MENSKILSLQGLRAFTFFGIFLSHSGVEFLAVLGAWGVSVFLILSGFLMLVNYYQRYRIANFSLINNFNFSVKKLSKLYFLHILLMLTAIPFAVRAIRENFIADIMKLLAKIFLNVTLTQSFIPHSAIYFSLNAVAWYLSVCLFLYFCFPYILHFFEVKITSSQKAIALIFSLVAVQVVSCFISSQVLLPSLSDNFTKWFVYIFPVMQIIEFIIGSALEYLFLHRKNSQSWNDTYLILSISSIFIYYAVCYPPPRLFENSMVGINLQIYFYK